MGVTLEAALGVTVGLLITGKVPDDQGLVAGCGQQHVGAIIKHSSQRLSHQKFNLRKSEVRSYFSREVAREVTQPLWPSRVPRRTSCSAMMGMSDEGGRRMGGDCRCLWGGE